MKHANGPPWRRLACWLLSLGAFLGSYPFLTASSLHDICKTFAEGKFQIRAMGYTGEYFYLLSSTGQLFAEDVEAFLENIKNVPPTIHLSKPLIDKLSSRWDSVSDPVDYANTKIQFGFIFKNDPKFGRNRLTLTMVNYTFKRGSSSFVDHVATGLCLYHGYQMNERKKPSMLEEDATDRCFSFSDDHFYVWNEDNPNGLAFWLTDTTMYPVQTVSGRKETTFYIDGFFNYRIRAEFPLMDKHFEYRLTGTIGVTDKATIKPLCGLYVEKVGILVAYQDSTVQLLPYPTDSSRKNKEWPISEFIVLDFCSKTKNDFPSKDSDKASKWPLKRIILYFVMIVCILGIVAVLAFLYLKKKNVPKKAQRLPVRITFSSVMSSTIHSLHSNFETHSPVSQVVPASAAAKAKKSKKKPKKTRKKQKRKLPAKVRKSRLKTAALSPSKQSPQLRKVPPSGASPRSVVTSGLNQLRQSVLSLKHSSQRILSKPSTSTVSQVSSLPRTQSTD